jgi:hypothetical protein
MLQIFFFALALRYLSHTFEVKESYGGARGKLAKSHGCSEASPALGIKITLRLNPPGKWQNIIAYFCINFSYNYR